MWQRSILVFVNSNLYDVSCIHRHILYTFPRFLYTFYRNILQSLIFGDYGNQSSHQLHSSLLLHIQESKYKQKVTTNLNTNINRNFVFAFLHYICFYDTQVLQKQMVLWNVNSTLYRINSLAAIYYSETNKWMPLFRLLHV